MLAKKRVDRHVGASSSQIGRGRGVSLRYFNGYLVVETNNERRYVLLPLFMAVANEVDAIVVSVLRQFSPGPKLGTGTRTRSGWHIGAECWLA